MNYFHQNDIPQSGKFLWTLIETSLTTTVATSSHRAVFDLKVQNHQKLFGNFQTIVTGDDPAVHRGKPHPDIFNVCAERFGATPPERVRNLSKLLKVFSSAIVLHKKYLQKNKKRFIVGLMKISKKFRLKGKGISFRRCSERCSRCQSRRYVDIFPFISVVDRRCTMTSSFVTHMYRYESCRHSGRKCRQSSVPGTRWCSAEFYGRIWPHSFRLASLVRQSRSFHKIKRFLFMYQSDNQNEMCIRSQISRYL